MEEGQRYYLREHRDSKHLSQDELSRLSEVDQKTISEIETKPERKRQGRVIRALCEALGITLEQLKRLPDDKATPEPLPRTEDELVDYILKVKGRGEFSDESFIRASNKAILRVLDYEDRERDETNRDSKDRGKQSEGSS